MTSEKVAQIIPDENNNSNVIRSDISGEMQKAYLDYAMSVIVSRALPDVRDGLKPVQRRIIYAMQDQHMNASGKFNKCAAVVGEVMKKYHPHGDTSIYEALVRMAQDFSLRYPLVWPQGNFGSLDGDPAAAMRYTECKMQKITEELYVDIDKETVNYEINDLQNFEPIYLPSILPNLLINGATGIAVGMATNIPPHNLTEVVDGLHFMIEKADNIGEEPDELDEQKIAKINFSSTATVEELVKIIKGPDFPTGGTVYDQEEIIQMYATGKGRAITRAKMEAEETKSGKMRLLVTEIPYMVNKSTLISKIALLVKTKKIEGIYDLRDESNKEGVRIVIELKKDAVVKKIQNQLFKYTPLQSTFNSNFVALINNEPKLMTLKMILEEFLKHRQQVIVRRTIYLLKKAREREHILRGLKIALDNLDAVIKLIRASKDADSAKNGLMENFALSEIQAQAILDMQLRKLAALERQKIEDELKEIQETIKDFESLLASPKRIIEVVQKELEDVKTKYGDDRKTKIIKGKIGEFNDEDLIPEEKCIITISNAGYIKRLKDSAYKKQKRGGKGVIGQQLKEDDSVDKIKLCNTHDWAMFITSKGKVYKMRIWELPETQKTAKGTPLVNFLSTSQDEKVEAFITMSSEDLEKSEGFIVFVTKNGVVKRTSLKHFENIRSSGIMAIKMDNEDYLVFADYSNGKDQILITTSQGQSIRFKEQDVRDMGRTARGVTGIKVSKKEDYVVGASIIGKENEKDDLLVVSEKGYGKKTSIEEYKVQNRAGSGILTYKVTSKTGKLVSAKVLDANDEEDLLIATTSGKIIRLSDKQVPSLGRATQGVHLIKLSSDDRATSIAVLREEDELELEETDTESE